MSVVSYQLSDKRGDAILVVKADGPAEHADLIYSAFGAAAQSAGLDAALQAFGDLPGAVSTATAILGGQPVPQLPQQGTSAQTYAAAPASWGQPPVPPFQPPAQQYQQPPMPAAAAPAAAPQCQHGTKVHRSGSNDRGTWNAWACPAPKGDPTQCKFEFIR
jgi:hypothetical protein